jgi:hypothetical protein
VGNRRRQDLAALAAATLVLVGAGVTRVLTYDGATTVSTSVLGQTFTRAAPTSTTAKAATPAPTTTRPPQAAAAPAPAPATTTTDAAPTTTTSARPAPSATTTTTAKPDCGTGETRAEAHATVVAHPDPGRYVVSGSVDVINNLTKAVVVDTLVVRFVYADQSIDLIEVPTAAGTQVEAGQTKTIPFDDQTTTKIPSSTSIEGLDYRVAGVAGCDPHHLHTA